MSSVFCGFAAGGFNISCKQLFFFQSLNMNIFIATIAHCHNK